MFKQKRKTFARLAVAAAAACALALSGSPGNAQTLPKITVVVGNNLGHLPMFVGADKGLFKKHGLDVQLKVVSSGTEMVQSMQKKEVEIGDMSVTTFLKARHDGDPFSVIALIMNDATSAKADQPLAIIARKDSGIRAGQIADLKGKRIGVWKEQTPDEYLKLVLARQGMRYEDVTIVNIPNNPALVPNLAEEKVDAVVSLEPFNTLVLSKVPGAYVVIRGGGYMSYIMVATAHEPTIKTSPDVVEKFVVGLAAASQSTRQNPDEAIEIFAKYVPNVDKDLTKAAVRHIRYDPRISKASLQAFDEAQDNLMKLTTKDESKRVAVPSVVLSKFVEAAEKNHPAYFADLPKVPAPSN